MSLDAGETSNHLKSVVYVIRELGLTTVVVLVLLGVFIGAVPSPMTETLQVVKTHSNDAVRFRDSYRKTLEELGIPFLTVSLP